MTNHSKSETKLIDDAVLASETPKAPDLTAMRAEAQARRVQLEHQLQQLQAALQQTVRHLNGVAGELKAIDAMIAGKPA